MSINLDHFSARILQDAFMTGRQSFWKRRAHEFESARSRPNDYLGKATAADVAAMDARLTGLARACRARAELAPFIDEDDAGDLGHLVLDEVAR